MRLLLSAFLASILVAAAFLLFSVYFQNVKPDDHDQIAEDAPPSVSLERPREDSETQAMGADVVIDFESDGRFKEMHCPIAWEEVERIRSGESDWRAYRTDPEVIDDQFEFSQLRIQTSRPSKKIKLPLGEGETTLIRGRRATCTYFRPRSEGRAREFLQLDFSSKTEGIYLPEIFANDWKASSGAHYDYFACNTGLDECRFLVRN